MLDLISEGSTTTSIPKGQAQDKQPGQLAYLGTDYRIQEDTQVEVEGEAVLASLEELNPVLVGSR